MQTAWIQMRRRVTQHLSQIQVVWHSDNIFTNLERHWRCWKFKQTRNLADENLFGGLRVKGWYETYFVWYSHRRLTDDFLFFFLHDCCFFRWWREWVHVGFVTLYEGCREGDIFNRLDWYILIFLLSNTNMYEGSLISSQPNLIGVKTGCSSSLRLYTGYRSSERIDNVLEQIWRSIYSTGFK